MEFKVNTGKLNNTAFDIDRCAKTIDSLSDSVAAVKNSLAIQGSAKPIIMSHLQSIIQEMNGEERSTNSLSTSLKSIAVIYEKTEQAIVGNATRVDGTSGAEEKKSSKIWEWSDTWKILSQLGIIGGVIATVGNLVTGGVDLGNILKSGKFLTSVIGGIGSATAAKGAGAKWADYLLGKNDAFSKMDMSSPGSAFGSSLKKQFVDGLNFGNAKTVGEKVKVGAKWAGHVLTAAANGVENYKEYKSGDISGARAVGETVIETGVDIAVGALATAGVAAAASAAGIVAAPAVAVGVAAAGVVWAANGICEWATGGKDIGEVAADGICDLGESVGAAVNSAASNISKGIGKVKKALGSVSTNWGKRMLAFG